MHLRDRTEIPMTKLRGVETMANTRTAGVICSWSLRSLTRTADRTWGARLVIPLRGWTRPQGVGQAGERDTNVGGRVRNQGGIVVFAGLSQEGHDDLDGGRTI